MRHPVATPNLRNRAGRDAGSAYLVTLLVLVVLTMLALALTFATQTEMLVGSNERVIQRAFYAAESALHLGVAKTLENRDKCPFELQVQDVPDGKRGSLVEANLEVDTVYPVADPPCEYCQINDEYEYSSNAYYKVNHALSVRGVLVGPNGEVVARKAITDMIDVQPWDDNLIPICAVDPFAIR